jgi:hypothetical protein
MVFLRLGWLFGPHRFHFWEYIHIHSHSTFHSTFIRCLWQGSFLTVLETLFDFYTFLGHSTFPFLLSVFYIPLFLGGHSLLGISVHSYISSLPTTTIPVLVILVTTCSFIPVHTRPVGISRSYIHTYSPRFHSSFYIRFVPTFSPPLHVVLGISTPTPRSDRSLRLHPRERSFHSMVFGLFYIHSDPPPPFRSVVDGDTMLFVDASVFYCSMFWRRLPYKPTCIPSLRGHDRWFRYRWGILHAISEITRNFTTVVPTFVPVTLVTLLFILFIHSPAFYWFWSDFYRHSLEFLLGDLFSFTVSFSPVPDASDHSLFIPDSFVIPWWWYHFTEFRNFLFILMILLLPPFRWHHFYHSWVGICSYRCIPLRCSTACLSVFCIPAVRAVQPDNLVPLHHVRCSLFDVRSISFDFVDLPLPLFGDSTTLLCCRFIPVHSTAVFDIRESVPVVPIPRHSHSFWHSFISVCLFCSISHSVPDFDSGGGDWWYSISIYIRWLYDTIVVRWFIPSFWWQISYGVHSFGVLFHSSISTVRSGTYTVGPCSILRFHVVFIHSVPTFGTFVLFISCSF